ncbi:hypothetical protein KAH37_03520 [bacterium]|nr:hypothetical protein [bacterium]
MKKILLTLFLSALFFCELSAVARGDVIISADEFVRLEWDATATTQSGPAGCMTSVANVYTSGNNYTGMAYDWGGYMSVATYNSELSSGNRAGSCSGSSCSTYGVLSCTSGVDCSGYVSIVWETGHYSTSSFHNISFEIAQNAMKKGDAFNNAGSHIQLYVYTDKSTGLPYIMEAAGTGTEKSVFRRLSSWPSSSYKRIRFDSIADDVDPSGTIANPIVIGSFPYSDSGNTRNLVSHVIDTYSASPSTKEFGPEFIYRFTLAEPGTLTAGVADLQSGVDNDIHLLSSLNLNGDDQAVDTIARNDSEVSEHLAAGVYYLVVDSYTGSKDFPGVYTMTATFVSDSGDSGQDEDVVDTADSVADADEADSGDSVDDGNTADSGDSATDADDANTGDSATDVDEANTGDSVADEDAVDTADSGDDGDTGDTGDSVSDVDSEEAVDTTTPAKNDDGCSAVFVF